MQTQQVTQHLTEKILPFWQNLADWERGGYFGYVEHDLTVRRDAHKGCILNSRILWTFATAARVTGNRDHLPYARHALDWMEKFEDKARGGVFWSVTAEGEPLDRTKHTYCQAFAIYGLAAYIRAVGEDDPRRQIAIDRAWRLFEVIERDCIIEGSVEVSAAALTNESDCLPIAERTPHAALRRGRGDYGEAFESDFSPAGNEKLSDNPTLMERGQVAQRTMNTLLHVLEAYAEFYRAVPDERIRQAGIACLERFLHVMYNEPARRLEVFYDKDYHTLLDMQSYGHDIEASWLMWDAAEALIPESEQKPYRDMCLTLAQSTCERAFTDHGMENEVVEGEVEHTRVWWVQAETVLGFMNAYELTGDEAWRQRAAQQWDYVQRVMVDPRAGGEWYWSVLEDGTPTSKPIVEEWKCPYHNGRMCLRLMERL